MKNFTFHIETIDGKRRIWFPAIEYRYHPYGDLHKYPPDNNNTNYTIVVNDIKEYEEIRASGYLYNPEHTGREQKPIIDERKTPGA